MPRVPWVNVTGATHTTTLPYLPVLCHRGEEVGAHCPDAVHAISSQGRAPLDLMERAV